MSNTKPGFGIRIQAWILRAFMSLPQPILRLFVGRPIVIDGNTLDLDIQVILWLQRLADGPKKARPSLEKLRSSEREGMALVGGSQPIGSVRDLHVDGAAGSLTARLYVPRKAAVHGGLLIYLHGGGWAIGDVGSYDPLCRFIAEESGVRVLSVNYRLAPEYPYPAGPEDAWSVLKWSHQHTAELGADPTRIAIGGDSAGASLAALAAIRAAETGLPVRLQLLIYPATRLGNSGRSRDLFGKGYMLDKEDQTFFEGQYLGGHARRDPGHSVGYRSSFPAALAPTVVAIAGFDPLRDEEKDYVELLRASGHSVTERFYPGLIHGFANIIGCGRSCKAAMEELAADLRAGLS